MAVDEKTIQKDVVEAAYKVTQATSAFAEQIRRHIANDPASMKQIAELPAIAEDAEAMDGEDGYIGAAVTLFLIWWRSHAHPE